MTSCARHSALEREDAVHDHDTTRSQVRTHDTRYFLGWVACAVAGFLALAVAGVTSADAQLVRAVYLAMHLITWFVIVPFSFAALVTGLVQSLGTPWGVFRHYWIVAKLALTVLATIVLLAHTQPIAQVAAVASQTMLASSDLRQLRIQLIADAGAAMMALLVATTLSVYKPWGMTAYGRRDERIPRSLDAGSTARASWGWFWLVGVIAVVALFAYLHLTGGGMHGH